MVLSKVGDMAATKRESQAKGVKLIGGMFQCGTVTLAVLQDAKSNGLQGYERVL